MSDTILFVAQDEKLGQRYTMELKETGYKVILAFDGDSAIEKLKKEAVDVVVLDLNLPDGSGLDYLLKFMDVRRDVKVVIHTADALARLDFRSWAADAFLIRSADSTELKTTLHKMLPSNSKKDGQLGIPNLHAYSRYV